MTLRRSRMLRMLSEAIELMSGVSEGDLGSMSNKELRELLEALREAVR